MKKNLIACAVLAALLLTCHAASTRAKEAAMIAKPLEATATGVFDVTRAPYDAVPNDDKDDTAAIQRAIDDATRAGGGKIFFGEPGTYNIDGAFQNINGANCQLRIPKVPLANHRMLSLTFEGPYPPPASPGGPLLQPDGGAILYSKARGSGQEPALLGCETPRDVEPSGTYVTIRNLTFRCRKSPDIAAIYLANVGNCNLENLAVDVNDPVNAMGHDPNGVGVYLPRANNLAAIRMRNVYVAGYGRGIVVGEHLSADELILSFNGVAIEMAFGYHANRFGRITAQYNEIVLDVTGLNPFSIQQLDMEDTGDGGVGNAALYLRDPANLGRGVISHHTVVSWHGYTSRFYKVGGKFLKIEDLWGSGGAPDDAPINSWQWNANELQSDGVIIVERDWEALLRDVASQEKAARGDTWKTPSVNLKAGSYAIQILCETGPNGAMPTAVFRQGDTTIAPTTPQKLDTYSAAPKKNVWLSTGFVTLPGGQTIVELKADDRNAASNGWQMKVQAVRIVWRFAQPPK